MSTSNLLNQNFDSEEEDDDFNPAPAAESEDEANGDAPSGDEEPRPRKSASRDQSRAPKHEDSDEEQDVEPHKEKNVNGKRLRDDEAEEGDVEEEDAEARQSDEDAEGGGEMLDDDDGDEEDDDDDEEAVSGRPRKRRRRGLNAFFEEEAEVDEDDDAEDDDEELGADGFVAETHPDDLAALPAGAETDDRRHRELDRQRELEASMDAEKQAQALKERYGRNRAALTDTVVVPKRLLLPSVEDPGIWGVRCKQGKEREVVFALNKRIQERAATRNPLQIFSAFERGGSMAGFVYVETRKKSDIYEAVDGMLNVYPRANNGIVEVSIKERPDLLRVSKSEELVPGGWVRIKRGRYQGDLAQIEEVETNGLDVTVRIVPRLDYGQNEDQHAPMNGDFSDPAKRKRANALALNSVANRPPQRLFSEQEAKKKHHKHLTAQSGLGSKEWIYMGDRYVDGFLIKDMKIQHLITQNVNPQLDEVTKFVRGAADGTENLDLASLAQTLKNTTTEDSYLPGDNVEVWDGEQQGVSGKTVSVRGDIVTLRVTEGELRGQTIDVPIKGLRKRFREGDHVKIIGGSRFRDELGMVVRIKDDRVTILSDMSMQEITVFSKDLREAADSGVDGRTGKYDVHDLIQTDPATVACVIKVDRESMRVLDQNGSIRTILPSQVTNKIEPRRDAVATDRNGAEIRHGDTVREVSGENKSGVILHIYRSFLFLHNRTQTENSGLFVARATNVATVAAKGGRITSSGPDLTKMNPALKMNGANGAGAMPPPKTFGRDRMLAKTVKVRRGPYKGLMGIVKDTTDSQARVELHSKSKTITVDKELLNIQDPITGQSIGLGKGPPRPAYGSAAPDRRPEWEGMRTPAAAAGSSARTPAWKQAGAATPGWAGGSGAQTPGWRPSGSATAYGGGGMTSYGGGRTPAWNSSAQTPYTSSGFSSSNMSSSAFDAFAAGAQTPSYNSNSNASSRTPAWGPGSAAPPQTSDYPTPSAKAYDAPTPGGYRFESAPTPAAYGSAPTPSAPTPRFNDDHPTPRPWNERGAESAPTPSASGANSAPIGQRKGGAYDAPTPAFDAPTPAAYVGAPTPAAGGGGADGGPRYAEDSDEE